MPPRLAVITDRPGRHRPDGAAVLPAQTNRESVQTLADPMVGDGLLDSAPDLDALYP